MRSFAFMLAPLIAVAVMLNQGKSKDPGGWNGARWGMTPAQVKAAFQGEPSSLSDTDPRPKGAKLVLRGWQAANRLFDTYFIFEGQRLVRVVMRPQPQWDPIYQAEIDPDAFEDLELALIKKYGKPTHKQPDGPKITTVWLLPQTTIELMRIDARVLHRRIVALEYKERTEAESDGL